MNSGIHHVLMQIYSNAVVTSSTIYPTIEILDKHSTTLQPLILTIDFPSILPWDVIDQYYGIVYCFCLPVYLEL